MASIRKRRSKYHVQIRRKEYPSITKTFYNITNARKWITMVEADIERNTYTPTDSVTVGEILKRYERTVLPKHKGANQEQYRINALISDFGSTPLSRLTQQRLITYRDTRLESVSPSTLRRDFNLLRSILNIAVKEWGVSIPINPVTLITLPKANDQRIRRLETGEECLLLEHTRSELRSVIILALETAMRRGEILNIKRSHIDFQKSVLLIPSTKTDTPRTIPLSTDAVTVLRAQLRASQSGYEGVIPLHEPTLFDYKPRGLSGEFLKLCRRKEIHDLHFHDLRHEATSRLFEKGLNPVEVATITGHKNTKMLMRYTHLRAEDLVGRLG